MAVFNGIAKEAGSLGSDVRSSPRWTLVFSAKKTRWQVTAATLFARPSTSILVRSLGRPTAGPNALSDVASRPTEMTRWLDGFRRARLWAGKMIGPRIR